MQIEFGILGVPQNWSNWNKNRFVMYEAKKEWLDTTVILGRQCRARAGLQVAGRGHAQRTIQIVQSRVRFLDKDGLYISAKPIIDGLKTELRRKIDKKYVVYEGAGFIFNDDEVHADWDVKQIKADGEPQVRIKITIPD